MKWYVNAVAVTAVAASLGACSSGGLPSSPLATAPSPTASASSAATAADPSRGSVSISFYVPAPSDSASASVAGSARSRVPEFIAKTAQSVVATIDEPNIDQANLQHRVEPYAVTPGQNTVTFYAPPGTLTLRLSLFDGPMGKGNELARTVPSTMQPPMLTINSMQMTPLNVTFNPIILSTNVVETSKHPGAQGVCFSYSGQLTVAGVDADGNLTYGPGMYLDTSGTPVTITVKSSTTSSPLPTFGYQLLATAVSGSVSSSFAVVNFAESAPAAQGAFTWAVDTVSSSPLVSGGTFPLDSQFCFTGGGG